MKLTIEFGLILAFGFAFVAWGFGRVLDRWGAGWGVRDVRDTAGLPLFSALLSVYFFVATPITNGIIRAHEAEAEFSRRPGARRRSEPAA